MSPTSRDSYRLPIADVIGELVLMPHAVYAAAALLSGAHGGLPNIEDSEKDRLRDVITEIYTVFQESWSDPRVKPPWLRGGRDQHGEPITEEKAEAATDLPLIVPDTAVERMAVVPRLRRSTPILSWSARPTRRTTRRSPCRG